jgi:hypothetical protein
MKKLLLLSLIGVSLISCQPEKDECNDLNKQLEGVELWS